MKLTLQIWRQESASAEGRYEDYVLEGAGPEFTLLEALDKLNDQLVAEGRDPVAFDSDCREGICGSCGVTVDGRPHGPVRNTPSCRQHLRSFHDGATVRLEPFRSGSYRVVRDLAVDRSGLERVIQGGGYASIDAGTAPDADARPLTHEKAEYALDMAACIGCGACVAARPNGSANLYVGAKLLHLATMPSTKAERSARAKEMTRVAEEEFGPCSLYGECVEVCPAGIPITAIAGVNRLANPAQREMIDRVETDGVRSPHIRLAFEVDDAAGATRALAAEGGEVLATPRETPWRSLNARLEAPAGLQITLFQELGSA